MKKTLLIAIITCLCAALSAQTYKLVPVFEDRYPETYLSHWKVLENAGTAPADTFSLWGYHRYFDDLQKGTYEVSYFKGDARATYLFLKGVVDFSLQYRDQDKVQTTIAGVRVRTSKELSFRYTLVFDKENKVICMYNLKQWTEILKKMEDYCLLNKIAY